MSGYKGKRAANLPGCPICGPNYQHGQHEDDSYGACVICREYVPHTDDDTTLVAWPCPTVRLAAAEAEIKQIRMALWLACPHPMKYGDDGEMQCHGADFLRDTTDSLIQHVWYAAFGLRQ